MLSKKFLVIFSLFMVLLCCFSAVSASEDVTDNLGVISDDVAVDEVVSVVDSDDGLIAASNDENVESVDDSGNESLAVQDEEQVNDVEEVDSTLTAEDDNGQTQDVLGLSYDEVLSDDSSSYWATEEDGISTWTDLWGIIEFWDTGGELPPDEDGSGTITIPKGYYKRGDEEEGILLGGLLYEEEISENKYRLYACYDGAGSVLDAVNFNHFYRLNFADEGNELDLSLKNFKFINLRGTTKNSYTSDFITNADEDTIWRGITLINCTFENCQGRLFSQTKVNLINCTFINCDDYHTAGDDFNTIIDCKNNIKIMNCTFIDCVHIFKFDKSYTNVYISNNTFIGKDYVFSQTIPNTKTFVFEDNYIVINKNGQMLYGDDGAYVTTPQANCPYPYYNHHIICGNYPLKTNVTASVEGSNLIFVLDTSDNGNLTLDDGAVVKITEGKGSTPITASPGGTVEGTITGYLGEKYYALSSDYSLTVPKLSPNLNITADDLEFEYNQPVEIAIELESQTANEANVSIYDKNGKLVDSKLTKGTATFNNLAAGEYTINVIYDEDDTFTNDSATATLTITKATPELTLDVVNTTSTLEISINTDIDEDIVVNVNGDEYKLNKDNTTFTLTNQGEGKYYVTATYGGNENYTSVSKNKTVTLSKVDADLKVKAEVADNVVTITATLTPTTGTITYFVNNKQYTKAVGEELIIDDLTPGNYTVFASYAGDSMYNAANANDTFTISEKTKADPELKLSVEDSVITVSINSAATGDVIVTVGDISFVCDAGALAPIDVSKYLGNGTYSVSVKYVGDDNFTDASDSGSVTVPEEEQPVQNETELVTPEMSVKVTNTTVEVTLPDDATGNVLVDVDGQGYYAPVKDGKATVNVIGLDAGTYPVTVNYLGDDKYSNATKSASVTVPDEDQPVVELKDPNLKLDIKDTVVTVSIDPKATGDVIVTVGDISFVSDAQALAPIDVSKYLGNGTYSVSVRYVGDDNFTDAAQIGGSVTVPEEEQPVQNETELVTPEMSVKVTNTTVEVTFPKDATGNVLVDVDGQGYYAPVKDGKASVNVIGLDAGTYPVTVTYTGDDKYANATKSASVTVPEEEQPAQNETEPVTPEMSVKVTNTTIDVTLPGDATGYVLADVNGQGYYAKVTNGKASIDIVGLDAGTYPVTVDYLGDDKYVNATKSASVTIPEEDQPVQNETEPVTPQMSVKVTNTTIEVTLPGDATGNVLVDVNGQGYYAPVKDGKASIDVIGLDAGTYPATVKYAGDDKYANATGSARVTVPKDEELAQNETEPVDSNAKVDIGEDAVNVELPKDATGYVLVDVDGKGYYAPVKDGKATLELPELDEGEHTVSVTYTGDDKYKPATANKTITVEKEIATVVTEDLTKVEKGTGSFVANFTDENGNPLANTKVTFEINGGTYTRTTNANGQATFAVNLVPGTYTMVTTNPVTKESATNTITVLPRFTEDSDLVKYFRNDSQYVLKVLDDDGNPVKAGEIVTYNINGVFYNRTTNASGHVKLNINLPPDTYIITAEYKGCKVAHTVKVLPTLTGSDITKKYGQAGAYEAKLVDGQGKAYANQKIEFNINGVMYQRTTNADGVAKLNINLQAGKYIISASYGQARISNTVTVTA